MFFAIYGDGDEGIVYEKAFEDLATINYCFYTLPFEDFLTGTVLLGEEGKNYHLNILWQNDVYTAQTRIPEVIPLDSLWFKREGHPELGFLWAHLTEPDTTGNGYRWYAQRINQNEEGQPKDASFVAPLGSAFDDRFINGKSFDFVYGRGASAPGDPPEEAGFFKLGDTVLVKFSTCDQGVFQFLRTFESEIGNNGNPFASPSPIRTNIQGGALGVWAGYGSHIDTIFATQ